MNDVLKVARIRKRITQKELAVSIGVTSKYISLIESKDIKPSPNIMQKIANCVDVPVQELFFRNICG